MKRILCFIIVLFVCCILHTHAKSDEDNLLQIVRTTKDIQQKFAAYRNLADIHFEEPAERTYLKLAYAVAKQSNNTDEQLNILSDLVRTYIGINHSDSVQYYMGIIRKEADPKDAECYLAYLRIRIFDSKIRSGKEEAKAIIEKEMNFLAHADKSNIYIRIEQAYITGYCLRDNKDYKAAIPYLETAYNLARTLSCAKRLEYTIHTAREYSVPFRFLGSKAKSLELSEKVLKYYQEYYDRFYAKQRPYYPIHLFYLQCYSTLIMHADIMPKEKSLYYINEIKQIATKVVSPFDKYNCFLALNNYSSINEDYKNALIYNDSLIKYAKDIAPTMVPGLLNTESKLYVLMNDYENALKSHMLYVKTKDSLDSEQAQEQINELQVQYEIDKLTYEKTRMADKNKLTLLIILTFVLLLVCSACIYLYFNLKREKRMKQRLRELNEKAEESEKLKTAFLNSMCHEIRTPLNSIVGFSGIIADESIEPSAKHELYELIETNSNKLTTLIDHLLIVSNLDSSQEKLPCKPTDIKLICEQEMEKAQHNGKSDITYTQEYPQENIFIPTNDRYLALVIENLLDNANKFAAQGEINLSIKVDSIVKKLNIVITDNGPGIPHDKQEYVFQRFTKLDSFVPGNGLGLYLCRLVVKRLSGNILIDPTYTDGARFIISLPMQ